MLQLAINPSLKIEDFQTSPFLSQASFLSYLPHTAGQSGKIRRIFFLFIFGMLYTGLMAQDSWPEIGTKWYYSIRENPFGSAATGYLKFEVSKDTIVEGQSCRILEKTQYTTDSKIINVAKEFIYSDNNKLYHFQKDNFYLLYDYSLEATDTFQIKLYYPAQSIDTIMNIVVDSVSTVEIDDSLLKKFYY